jgi:hypothetical protein
MKQPEDTHTLDLLGSTHQPPTPSKDVERYAFYITTTSGEVVEWRGLTLHQARVMQSTTDKHLPPNIENYGWEVQG